MTETIKPDEGVVELKACPDDCATCVTEAELKSIENDWDYYCREHSRIVLCHTIRQLWNTRPVPPVAGISVMTNT